MSYYEKYSVYFLIMLVFVVIVVCVKLFFYLEKKIVFLMRKDGCIWVIVIVEGIVLKIIFGKLL